MQKKIQLLLFRFLVLSVCLTPTLQSYGQSNYENCQDSILISRCKMDSTIKILYEYNILQHQVVILSDYKDKVKPQEVLIQKLQDDKLDYQVTISRQNRVIKRFKIFGFAGCIVLMFALVL